MTSIGSPFPSPFPFPSPSPSPDSSSDSSSDPSPSPDLDSLLLSLQSALASDLFDSKIAALDSLSFFLNSLPIINHDQLLRLSALLKSALDNPIRLIPSAALALLPPLASALALNTNFASLKLFFVSIYPHPSFFSLLADSKPKHRQNACAALIALTTAVCQAILALPSTTSPTISASAHELLQDIERFVKLHGFQNKNPRARVQAILYLSHIRPRFPSLVHLKSYLPILVSLLEDPDPSVRSAASECLASVFADPNLPPSARADLKNELASQATRKSTVDHLLAKVFSTPNPYLSENLSHSPALLDSAPPSLASSFQASLPTSSSLSSLPGSEPPPSVIIHPVFVSGPRELESIFSKMLPPWQGKETEHNWLAREANITTLRGMIKTNAHTSYTPDFIAGLKLIADGLLKSLASLRTTMAVGVCNALAELTSLGNALDPLVELFLPALLRMAAQTKKIVLQASQAAASAIIKSASYHPKLVQFLVVCVHEKTVQARGAGMKLMKEFVDLHGQRSRLQIESGTGLAAIEKALRRALADPSPLVREAAREVFWASAELWPAMTNGLFDSLDGSTRKQLEKASGGLHSLPPSSVATKPATKRTSVRALIRSSRIASQASTNPPPTEPVRSPLRVLSAPSPARIAHSSASPSPERVHPKAATRQLSPAAHALSKSTSSPLKSHLPSPSHPKVLASPSLRPAISTHSLRARSASAGKSSPIRPSPQQREPQPVQEMAVKPREKEEGEEVMVEDAMRAQAAQAESAAQRLLEIAEDEQVGTEQELVPLGPGGVLLSGSPLAGGEMPVREGKHAKESWKNGTFMDSPRHGQGNGGTGSLEEDNGMGAGAGKQSWWDRQAELLMFSARGGLPDEEVCRMVARLEKVREVETRRFYIELGKACGERACVEDGSGVAGGGGGGDDNGNKEKEKRERAMEFWSQAEMFDRMFEGLVERLKQDDVPLEIKDGQLILLRSIVVNLPDLLYGKEVEVCRVLLSVVEKGGFGRVSMAAESVGLILSRSIEPVYGLSSVRQAVCTLPSVVIGKKVNLKKSTKVMVAGGVREDGWLGACVRWFGVLLERLPGEIVVEELGKCNEMIMMALNHESTEIRMSAVWCLVGVNKVLKDERIVMEKIGLGNLSSSNSEGIICNSSSGASGSGSVGGSVGGGGGGESGGKGLSRAQVALLTYYLAGG